MFTNPVATGTVAFLVVFVGMIALGYLLTHGDGKAALRLRQLGVTPTPLILPTASTGAGREAAPALLQRLARLGRAGTARKAELRAQCLCAASFTPAPPQCSSGPRFS